MSNNRQELLNNGAAVGPQGEGRDGPSNFSTYPAYKDSGVEWLGAVPESWKVSGIKFFADLITGITPPSDDLDNYAEEGWPWVRPEDLNDSGKPVLASKFLTDQGWRFCRKVKRGSTLICCIGTIGKIGFVDSDVCTNQQITAVVPRGNGRFFFYAMQALKPAFDVSATGNVLRILNSERLGNVTMAVPDHSEAESVARFLDHETARIDALIAEQQRLIELLKEKRQAVISHAVTKGLNPDAPMKDSGVEWLGEVPAHWDVVSLKRVVVFQRGHDLPSESREEGNVPVISSGGYSGTHSVACAKAPGIVTGRYGSIGQFTLATEDYWPLNTALYSIELYGNKPRYVWYLLQGYAEHFLLNSLKSAVPGVDRNDVHVVKVVAAPVEEQDQIVTYIDRISNQLDQLVDAAERNVTLLQERRSALISAAVTGKIDVRGWQPPASTQAPESAVAEAV